MNEFDDIDRELEAAFAQRPTALSRPSLRDVKHRARRHQRQRRAAVLSACALAGVGGVTALAQRSPGSETTAREGLDGANASTIPASCAPATVVDTTFVGYDTTTVPPPGAIAGSYTLVAGDFPGLVAEMFGVTVAELNAVNLEVNGYGGFIVGTEINIPTISASTTTTTTPDFAPASTIFPPSTVYGSPCSPLPVANFRCSGESLASGDGWTYFEYCEALKFEPAPTWPATPEQIAPTTYICVELPIVTLPPPATTTTIFGAC